MDNFEEILMRVYLALGIKNQKQLAEVLGITPPGITDAKNRGAFPSDWVVKISMKGGVNPAWLLTGTEPVMITGTSSNIAGGPDITMRVPLISFVQAGEWSEAIEGFSPENAEDFYLVTSSVGSRAFALRVVGNSMEPEFREGEIVIVDPDKEAETGAFVIAKINHDEATFKQLIKDGGSVFLRPLNGAYPVMDVTGRDLRIVGRVVEKVKRY